MGEIQRIKEFNIGITKQRGGSRVRAQEPSSKRILIYMAQNQTEGIFFRLRKGAFHVCRNPVRLNVCVVG